MNPFNALAEFALGWMKQTQTAKWLKFLFELGFSAVCSFLFTCGGSLMFHRGAGWSIGFGMVWAAMAMVLLFRRERSRLTAGMIIVLPGDEAAKEMAADFQIIQKSEDTK